MGRNVIEDVESLYSTEIKDKAQTCKATVKQWQLQTLQSTIFNTNIYDSPSTNPIQVINHEVNSYNI